MSEPVEYQVDYVTRYDDGSGMLNLEPELFPRPYYASAPGVVTRLDGRIIMIHDGRVTLGGRLIATVVSPGNEIVFVNEDDLEKAVSSG